MKACSSTSTSLVTASSGRAQTGPLAGTEERLFTSSICPSNRNLLDASRVDPVAYFATLHHEKIEQAKTRMTANTAALLAGHAVLLTLFGSLWLYLPAPGDRAPRWAGTPLENYVLAAYCVGFAMVLALLTGGYLNYFS